MSFSDDIKRFKKKAEKAATLMLRGTALDMFGRIVKRTPVGNPSLWKGPAPAGYTGGALRSNWQIGINSPKGGILPIEKDVTRKTIKLNTVKLKDAIFITNNLPYANAVEFGSSSQAPAGMLRVTVAEFKKIVNKNAKK
jgi:hypothetical protein